MYAHGLFVQQKCSNHALINLLFSLCTSVWIINLLVTRPSSHPIAPTCPFIPKMLQVRKHTPTLSSSIVFTFELAFESFKECGGASLETYPKPPPFAPIIPRSKVTLVHSIVAFNVSWSTIVKVKIATSFWPNSYDQICDFFSKVILKPI
jgi:hypothetical protein